MILSCPIRKIIDGTVSEVKKIPICVDGKVTYTLSRSRKDLEKSAKNIDLDDYLVCAWWGLCKKFRDEKNEIQSKKSE